MLKKIKIILNTFLIVCICFISMACAEDNKTPLNVTFKNGTLSGSTNYVVSAVYLEDKRTRDLYTDIFVMADKDNFEITITKELEVPVTLVIPEKNVWFSLTNLINRQTTKYLELTTFSKAEPTTYIFQAKQTGVLKFKAMGGNFEQELTTGIMSLTNAFDVSKPIEIPIEKI